MLASTSAGQAFYALAVDTLPGTAKVVLDEAASSPDPTLEGDQRRLLELDAERRTHLARLAQLELPEASDARFAGTRASLVLAEPATGRRHQIRRHLKHIAHEAGRTGEWHDVSSTWWDVTCFRALAENAARALAKGSPVVVRGTLEPSEWTSRDGVVHKSFRLVAGWVAYDLTRHPVDVRRDGGHHRNPAGYGDCMPRQVRLRVAERRDARAGSGSPASARPPSPATAECSARCCCPAVSAPS